MVKVQLTFKEDIPNVLFSIIDNDPNKLMADLKDNFAGGLMSQ